MEAVSEIETAAIARRSSEVLIEQSAIERSAARNVERAGRVVSHHHVVVGARQCDAHLLAHRFLVIDDEDHRRCVTGRRSFAHVLGIGP